jgi:competence protein ComEA
VAGLSRAQLAVYGAVAVALLLIGARAVRGETAAAPFPSSSDGGGGSGGFELSQTGGGGDVVVDVTGAVQRPGVYRLPAGSRVVDAVQRAGGAGPKGLLEAVNLAAHLADGQQIVIPEQGPAGGAAVGAAAGSGPISLGSATAGQLATIDGIGPVTARDIIEYRDQHGGLASVEQLDQVSGIGPATMQSLREGLQP